MAVLQLWFTAGDPSSGVPGGILFMLNHPEEARRQASGQHLLGSWREDRGWTSTGLSDRDREVAEVRASEGYPSRRR